MVMALCGHTLDVESTGGPFGSRRMPEGLMCVLPRQSMSWPRDSAGQVIGVTCSTKPLPGRVRALVPTGPLPSPLSVKEGLSSLHIVGRTERGMERDIALLQWSGSTVSWQRMPVPAAVFSSSLDSLSRWMLSGSFTVTFEDGSAVRIVPEADEVVVSAGTTLGSVAIEGVGDFPQGAQLAVLDANSLSDGTQAVDRPVTLGCSGLSCQVSPSPGTVLDVEVITNPPQVRVTTRTTSRIHLEQAVRELDATERVLKDAPSDQRAILERERAALQGRIGELRKAMSSERVQPTDTPMRVSVIDPASGRQYVNIMISIVESTRAGTGGAASGAAGDRGIRSRAGQGAR